MIALNSLFDDYGIRARLLPVLVLVLPPAVVIAMLSPAIYETYTRIFSSLGAVAVVLYLLAHVIRARGRRIEHDLYAEWGGIPTTAWLRHRDTRVDPITKARYHKFLEAHVHDLKMPLPAEESADPKAADHRYDSAVKWMLEYTRDKTSFPLIFEENVSYGFRRNALAAKPLALTTLFILILIVAWITYKKSGVDPTRVDSELIATWVIVLASCIFWLLLTTKAWVKDASDAYARAFLAACDKEKNSN